MECILYVCIAIEINKKQMEKGRSLEVNLDLSLDRSARAFVRSFVYFETDGKGKGRAGDEADKTIFLHNVHFCEMGWCDSYHFGTGFHRVGVGRSS